MEQKTSFRIGHIRPRPTEPEVVPGGAPRSIEPEVISGGGPRPTEPEIVPGDGPSPTEQAGKKQAGDTSGFMGEVESDLANMDWLVGMCGNGDIDMLLGSNSPKPDWMYGIGSSSASNHEAVPGISDFYSRDAFNFIIPKASGHDALHNQESSVRELLHLMRLMYADQKNVVFMNGNGVSFVLTDCCAMLIDSFSHALFCRLQRIDPCPLFLDLFCTKCSALISAMCSTLPRVSRWELKSQVGMVA